MCVFCIIMIIKSNKVDICNYIFENNAWYFNPNKIDFCYFLSSLLTHECVARYHKKIKFRKPRASKLNLEHGIQF